MKIINFGDHNMNAINKLGYKKIIEVARNMGYDPQKPTELNKYINDIAKMDEWDISKILFFSGTPKQSNNKAIS
jgi:hypothetical protein